MRSELLPFALPDLDDSEWAEIRQVLESGWITTGPKVRQFEHEFAACVGARHAVAVNSCTAAMHLALEAVGLRRGDLVLTTPYTFAATAEVVRYFDAVPLFVDIEPGTLNVSPARLAATLEALAQGQSPPGAPRQGLPHAEPRVTALLPVHIAGHPCDMEAIDSLAARYGVPVIEDAAHALPAARAGRKVGMFPRDELPAAACFSFYATKTLTTGEGGMITTDSEEVAGRCRIMSLHGLSRDAWKRYTSEGSWYYEIVAPGFKYNMTDVAAAMGLAQLRKVERMRARRAEIARRYTEAFAGVAALEPPTAHQGVEHAWHLYVLRLHLDRLTIDRNRFVEELKALRIATSVHFMPLHLHPYYRETYGYRAEDFPVAYREYQRVVSLPIYSRMSDADVDDVIEAVTGIAASCVR